MIETYMMEGSPIRGKELERLKQFLNKMDLQYDEGIEYTVCIYNEEYEIIGTGSVDYNVIKCVAIDPGYQGMGLSARIISMLIQYEFEKERTHIYIYTKPKNLTMFTEMGFHKILLTSDILFMENRPYGFENYLKNLIKETPLEAMETNGKVGAIVANCNPFTNGHRYLIEKALKECEYLHLFVLSDNRSKIPANTRYELVKEGIKDLKNVILHQTSDYMVSAATFPTYFFKDVLQGQQAKCQLDLALFGKKIAPALSIGKRFVGTEPNCQITKSYNEEMKKTLPQYGIDVIEIQRKCNQEKPISASDVRKYLDAKEYDKLIDLIPENELLILKRL